MDITQHHCYSCNKLLVGLDKYPLITGDMYMCTIHHSEWQVCYLEKEIAKGLENPVVVSPHNLANWKARVLEHKAILSIPPNALDVLLKQLSSKQLVSTPAL